MTAVTLDAIARPTGGLAMVAMDQRESLRHMFDQAGKGRPADDVLVAFKRDVARQLGDLGSGFLVDRDFGGAAIAQDGLLPSTCGFLMAADALEQQPGGPVEDTDLDMEAFDEAVRVGAAGVKLLVIWRRDERRQDRVAMSERFIAEAKARGLLSVLEPVVRATEAEVAAGDWDPEEAIAEAARELSPLGAALYKVQVPGAGVGEPAELQAAADRLARSITGPWVVLSQGVALDRFPAAVEAACRAGASGFLSGRALWSDVVGSDDVPAALVARSRPRLERLTQIVDQYARLWNEA